MNNIIQCKLLLNYIILMYSNFVLLKRNKFYSFITTLSPSRLNDLFFLYSLTPVNGFSAKNKWLLTGFRLKINGC